MRQLLAFLFLCSALPYPRAALAQSRAPLTHVQEVVALTNAQAAQAIPVKLEATVTYPRPSEKNLFVMENGSGIYIRFAQDIGLMPGDRVAVTGVTAPSFRPIVVATEVRFLAPGILPAAQPATFAELIRSEW